MQDPTDAGSASPLDLTSETVQFDENGNPLVVRDPKGQTITSTFDELNRLEAEELRLRRRRPVAALAVHDARSSTATTRTATC